MKNQEIPEQDSIEPGKEAYVETEFNIHTTATILRDDLKMRIDRRERFSPQQMSQTFYDEVRRQKALRNTRNDLTRLEENRTPDTINYGRTLTDDFSGETPLEPSENESE